MSLVCAQCSRVNPAEAAYCYHDGAALAGHAGGPINAGSAPFPSQFVFPNGQACRNFDQLALACQQHWSAAIDLLKQGYLGSFFGGMGRIDLATAAQESAKFPDLDRGLDQLIAKLPTQAVQPPKLQAEPTDINLGQIKVGTDRASELHLTNLGMRLLYGTATSDCKWLLLGDAPGHGEKMFQFGSEQIIAVQLRGQHLRAGTKPLEGHLILDSNGGTMTVTVRADVPITPYDGGLFAGATTPRKIAEKAKANVKEAIPYFEKGDVAKWYASNGWAYPVQGPIMPGTGAIQQFFEALGVAKPPKVEVATKSLDLAGAVGKTVEGRIEVSSAEKKVVYGWATCDQPWVDIGKTKLAGRTAAIPIRIRIPDPCPPILETTIHVVGNGNYKANVPLKVTVAGGKAGVNITPEEVVSLEVVEDDAPMMLEVVEDTKAPAPAASPPIQTAAEASPFAAIDESTSAQSGDASAPMVTVSKPAGRLPWPVLLGLRLIPFVLLFICLLGLIARDIFTKADAGSGGGPDGEIDTRPHVKVQFDEGKLGKDYTDSMNFAVHKINPSDNNAPSVKLNWYVNGAGNSIVAMIDGKEAIFGATGKWTALAKPAGKYMGGKSRTFEFANGIYVTQTVTIEPGDPIQVGPEEYKRLLSLCLVRYKIHNLDKQTHKVGLRVLMDTCIGDNDGVPFTLPGVAELVSTSKKFVGSAVPDFVQVLERPNLKDPGTILQLNLKLDEKKIEAPGQFLLTRYPGKQDGKFNKWNVDIRDIGDDSCVVMYWDPKDLKAGQTREIGFTYGLGNVTIAMDKLGLTVGGASHVGGELTVVALVADQAAKTATIELPKGLELIDKNSKTQQIMPMRTGKGGVLLPSPVTWRVRAVEDGKHEVTVKTDNGLKQSRRVTITKTSLFN